MKAASRTQTLVFSLVLAMLAPYSPAANSSTVEAAGDAVGEAMPASESGDDISDEAYQRILERVHQRRLQEQKDHIQSLLKDPEQMKLLHDDPDSIPKDPSKWRRVRHWGEQILVASALVAPVALLFWGSARFARNVEKRADEIRKEISPYTLGKEDYLHAYDVQTGETDMQELAIREAQKSAPLFMRKPGEKYSKWEQIDRRLKAQGYGVTFRDHILRQSTQLSDRDFRELGKIRKNLRSDLKKRVAEARGKVRTQKIKGLFRPFWDTMRSFGLGVRNIFTGR